MSERQRTLWTEDSAKEYAREHGPEGLEKQADLEASWGSSMRPFPHILEMLYRVAAQRRVELQRLAADESAKRHVAEIALAEQQNAIAERQADAAEHSARASIRSADAAVASATAGEKSALASERSVYAGERAADAADKNANIAQEALNGLVGQRSARSWQSRFQSSRSLSPS